MKTQMKFQKAVALVSLIMAALCCVYALIFMTDISAIANYTSTNNGGEQAFRGADRLYNFANDINGALLIIAIVFLLISVTLYITASNKRRNYYVTNYVSIIATAAFAVVVALFGIIVISICLSYYVAIDHAAYKALYNTWVSLDGDIVEDSPTMPTIPGDWSRQYPNYSDSPAMLIIGYVVNLLVLGVAAMNVLNLIWKIKLMKGEKALLQQGFVKEVA